MTASSKIDMYKVQTTSTCFYFLFTIETTSFLSSPAWPKQHRGRIVSRKTSKALNLPLNSPSKFKLPPAYEITTLYYRFRLRFYFSCSTFLRIWFRFFQLSVGLRNRGNWREKSDDEIGFKFLTTVVWDISVVSVWCIDPIFLMVFRFFLFFYVLFSFF